MAGGTYQSTAKLKLTGHLTAKVTINDEGPPYTSCEPWRKVVIQRRKGGKWTKVEAGTTGPLDSANGSESQPWGVYKSGIPDKGGKYRAVAKKKEVSGGTCVKAVSKVIKHTH